MFKYVCNKCEIYFQLFLLYIDSIANIITSLLAIVTPLYYGGNFYVALPGVLLTSLNYMKVWYQNKKKMKLSDKERGILQLMCENKIIDICDIYGNNINLTVSSDFDLLTLALNNSCAIIDNMIICYDYSDEKNCFFWFKIKF